MDHSLAGHQVAIHGDPKKPGSYASVSCPEWGKMFQRSNNDLEYFCCHGKGKLYVPRINGEYNFSHSCIAWMDQLSCWEDFLTHVNFPAIFFGAVGGNLILRLFTSIF